MDACTIENTIYTIDATADFGLYFEVTMPSNSAVTKYNIKETRALASAKGLFDSDGNLLPDADMDKVADVIEQRENLEAELALAAVKGTKYHPGSMRVNDEEQTPTIDDIKELPKMVFKAILEAAYSFIKVSASEEKN